MGKGVLIVKKGKKDVEEGKPMVKERLIKTTVYIEEEVKEALEELAEKLTAETGRKWSSSGVIRLALSEFFSGKGKII